MRLDLVAVLQDNADGLAILHQHLLNAGVGSDLAAVFLQRTGDGIRDGAHAATGQAPGADAAVDIAHDVVQQDIGGARRVNTERRADDARAGHRGLDQVVLEIVFEILGGAHREEAHVLVDLLFTQCPELLGEEQQFPDVPRPE